MNWIGNLWRGLGRLKWVFIGLAVFLGLVRLALPFAIERYVNHQLNTAKDFGGRIGGVHLQLWRGRYRINKIEIYKRNGQVHVPFFSADQIYLAIEWKELFHGSVVGQIIMSAPKVNFVAGPTEAQSQSGKDEDWGAMLKSLFPFHINRLEITNGQVHFKNQYSTPPVDIYLNELSSVTTNLTNSRKVKGEMPAGIQAHATTIGGGDLDLKLKLGPMAHEPTYELNAQLTNVDLTALNDFLRAYGKFDVARGDFAVFTSVASKGGNYDGYVKVFFNRLKVFAWEKERGKDALKVFWDAIVGGVTSLLKNQKHDSLATRVPISGTYGENKVGTWTAIETLLRHAFVRSLVPAIDQKVTLQDVKKTVQNEKKLEKPMNTDKGAQELVNKTHP